MKKIFLISPSLQWNVQVSAKDNSYGLGLAYLHAVIEHAGYQIRTVNYNNIPADEAEAGFSRDMAEFQPDFLLVQIFTMNRVESYRLIRLAKQNNPGIKIIAGGVHASIYPDQILENFPVDYVVIGEGERTILELLNALSFDASTKNIMGIAYKIDGKTVHNPDRTLIEDLDSIPFPRHGLFIKPGRKMACILTTRGCPFKCSFCCLHAVSKRKFRRRSVQNVLDEVEYILKEFPQITSIQLADDTFTLDLPQALEFCREVVRRGIKTKFLCSARIKPATTELFELMEKVGFISIGFGLETGSSELLKSIHKNITRDDAIETFNMLRDRKINIATYLMVGFPGETDKTVAETIDLIQRLQKIKYFDFAGVAKLWVYPNTEVYEYMRAAGVIDDSYWLTDKDVPFFTLEHTEEELDIMVMRITLACMPKRQMFRKLMDELLQPKLFAAKFMSRTRKLLKIVGGR